MKLLKRLKNKLPSKQDIEFFFQRCWRGWDDSETFSLDFSLAKIILPRLKRFHQIKCGYPASMTKEEWNIILDKMIAMFEFSASEARYIADKKEFDKHQEGLELFTKYYWHLWW